MTTGKTVGCELCQQLHSTRCSWFQHLHQYDRLAQLARAVVSRVRVPDRSARGNAPDLPTGAFPPYHAGGKDEGKRQRISDLPPLWAEDQNESNRRHHENGGLSPVVPVV